MPHPNPDALDMRVDENGPSFHASQAGQVAFHQPVMEEPIEAPFCRTYREAAERVTLDELFEVCRKRRAESECQACLGPLR